MQLRTILLAPAVLIVPLTANAQDSDVLIYNDADHLVTDMGAAIMVGGGALGRFTDQGDVETDTGGTWHVRGVLGTRSYVAGELAYIGSAQPIQDDVARFENDAVLLSNGGEADLRVQIPIAVGEGDSTIIAPFATAGLSVEAYDVINTDDDLTRDGEFGDDIGVHVPLGLGLSVASDGFIADARVNYRPAVNDAAIFEEDTVFDNAMDALMVSASIGVEF